jgi:hypothetical protein
VCAYGIGNMVGRPLAHHVIVVSDDQFHNDSPYLIWDCFYTIIISLAAKFVKAFAKISRKKQTAIAICFSLSYPNDFKPFTSPSQ